MISKDVANSKYINFIFIKFQPDLFILLPLIFLNSFNVIFVVGYYEIDCNQQLELVMELL